MTLLVFDSGIGGLGVVREIRRLQPEAKMTYLADNGFFPYGEKPDAVLLPHIVELIGRAIARFAPSAVVVACNTASTIALGALRAAYDVPVHRLRAADQAGRCCEPEPADRRARHRCDRAAQLSERPDQRLRAGLRGAQPRHAEPGGAGGAEIPGRAGGCGRCDRAVIRAGRVRRGSMPSRSAARIIRFCCPSSRRCIRRSRGLIRLCRWRGRPLR